MFEFLKIEKNILILERQNEEIKEKNKKIAKLEDIERDFIIKNNGLSNELEKMIDKKKELDKQIINRENFFIETEIKYINTLTGYEFETYCGDMLEKIGYNNVVVTQCSNDEGGDILAEKDNIKYVFQCKRYNDTVGNKAIQEVHTAKDLYECELAVVITNNTFTKQAEQEAEKLNIDLWDMNKLKEILYVVYHFDINHLDLNNIVKNTEKELMQEQAEDDDTDLFLMDAIDAVVEQGQASTSFIQRRFKVGYARAGKIIDQMEERGIISGYQGSKPREVLITRERLEELKMSASNIVSKE